MPPWVGFGSPACSYHHKIYTRYPIKPYPLGIWAADSYMSTCKKLLRQHAHHTHTCSWGTLQPHPFNWVVWFRQYFLHRHASYHSYYIIKPRKNLWEQNLLPSRHQQDWTFAVRAVNSTWQCQITQDNFSSSRNLPIISCSRNCIMWYYLIHLWQNWKSWKIKNVTMNVLAKLSQLY